jgi:flagellar basal body-associated protein FliL
MKKLICMALTIVLMAGAGFGIVQFLNKPAQASAKVDKKTEGDVVPEVSFVEMKPLVLPIVDQNGVSQIVSLVVSLEASSPETKAEIEKYSPRLLDAFIQDMYGALSRQAAMEGGMVQVGYIKSRLNRVTLEVLGKDKVKDVLLQVVQQRPV